jgi:hypothetical protein
MTSGPVKSSLGYFYNIAKGFSHTHQILRRSAEHKGNNERILTYTGVSNDCSDTSKGIE